MKWHHINTIKYQCTNLIINDIIINLKKSFAQFFLQEIVNNIGMM